MPPTRSKAKMKEHPPASTAPATHSTDPVDPPNNKETIVTAPPMDTPTTSPTFHPPSKTPPRKVSRLKCSQCNDYPDGFRSEHELRRHTNRIHKKTRKVWVTFDSSENKTFLANCKACQTGKRYNECYNAASHLRRMHFHPHKRGERKMTAAEARRGGKPGDLDPPMDDLKRDWLREVEEAVENDEDSPQAEAPEVSGAQLQPQPQTTPNESKAPPTPTTPSTRSMAIDSIVDKVDAS
ncbi:hypothetical protein EJ04DRAFT_507216 [Polyplosphaeria fusca]|uniref:DUF7896 domain-containing protein n=1 Tax=Polyplosphaeria fusca TaxID=682080 RepID=A0A9P4V7X5_9PLEO|nr:hypothetical protein EJ04DRAFT_507216 [Polyplosphaeria fusca]